MRRAITYSRVSSQEQAKFGYSLSMMEEQCQNYVNLQGGKIERKYVDAGYSGSLPFHRRPDMHRLLEDLRTKKDFDSIVVWRLDRLTRCLRSLLELEATFSKAGVSLLSAREMVDTSTAGGRAFFSMVGAFAEYEAGATSERTYSTMAAKTGSLFLGGKPAMGYKVIRGKLVVDQSAKQTIVMIFQEFLRHKNLSRVARILNERGMLTSYGRHWEAKKIWRILINPTYVGMACWSRKPEEVRRRNSFDKYIEVPGNHEALIDEKIFYRAQKIIQS